MYTHINIIGIGFLALIFVVLLIVNRLGRTSTAYQSKLPKRTGKSDRRTYPRYEAALRIKYKTQLNEGVSWIENISEGGTRLYLDNTLRALGMGEPLEIEVSLPNDIQPIIIKGDIVWLKDDNAGLRFVETIKADIEKIMQYVNREK